MSWLFLMILMPLAVAFFIPFLFKYVPRIHTGWFALAAPVLLFSYLTRFISSIANGESFLYTVSWIPSLGINFALYMDGLSITFGLLISGIGILVVFYSIFYMSRLREALHNFYVYLLLFMSAMLGVVFSDNIVVLYMFWEMTSISSFLLIAYWYQRKKSRYGAQKSLLITVSGGFLMLAGFILLSNSAGTYSIREIIAQAGLLAGTPSFLPAMLLILLGAFTKSAQFPFHIWLPDAMEAPTPISAYLHSATMVKAGIYLVARFTPVFGGTAEWFWIVSVIGLLTLLWGSFSAVNQTDLKALLAFSTISQLGMIMCLLGLGSAALSYGPGEGAALYTTAVLAAIFHLVNHSTFKGCLFMVVGIIDHETGTREIRRLGGLMRVMPVTFSLAAIGSLSMAGLPPFNGFLSKELFFTGVLNASRLTDFNLETWGLLFPVVAWIASIFTFVYCLILLIKPFMGKCPAQKLEKIPHEGSWGLLLPPCLLAFVIVLFFFFPNIPAHYLLFPAMDAILPSFAGTGYGIAPISAWHGLTPELFMTLGVFLIGSFLFVSRRSWMKIYGLLPSRFTLNKVYDRGLAIVEDVFFRITHRYMTGFIRHYLIYIFTFFVLVPGGFLLWGGSFSFNFAANSPIHAYEAILVSVTAIAAIATVFSCSRLTSIILVGVIGYMVSMFFVLFRAPDLALTQLVVETVTTALFLLCFYHLPKLKKIGRIPLEAPKLFISLGVGGIVTAVALSAQNHRLFGPISWFFENSYELAGANNIVNAILVDFRGFDTMLEILVFFIAGIGVYTLIKLRLDGGDRHKNQ